MEFSEVPREQFMAQRSDLGRQLPLRGPLKALEADIHHANAM
jgi:hypothetical protein